ncbi:MAG: hypothetical protein MTP17_03050 [Candidatus Midichloria sp.]|nr:MAG: hypothetical protein MTP17_03050 [Candidatus Midichloria sp.]
MFNILKKSMNFEHTKHRASLNFLVYILACVNAYNINKTICVSKLAPL